jgi:hypothetical protein
MIAQPGCAGNRRACGDPATQGNTQTGAPTARDRSFATRVHPPRSRPHRHRLGQIRHQQVARIGLDVGEPALVIIRVGLLRPRPLPVSLEEVVDRHDALRLLADRRARRGLYIAFNRIRSPRRPWHWQSDSRVPTREGTCRPDGPPARSGRRDRPRNRSRRSSFTIGLACRSVSLMALSLEIPRQLCAISAGIYARANSSRAGTRFYRRLVETVS